MANVLTDLAADAYKAADIVARELTGFIPSVTVNTSDVPADGQTVRSHVTGSATATDITPSMTTPEGTDQTVTNKTLSISKQRAVQIPWTGEDVRFVNAGSGFETIYGDQIAQAMRTLVNEIEADIGTDIYKSGSRAVGTAGTTPFASNHNIVNEARQIIADNGMPLSDGQLSLVMSTGAGVNFRNLSNLYKVNEAGTDRLLRQGVLQDISGIMMRESAQVQSHTKGTGSGYLLNDASSAIGDTTIAADTGSGTILAGDIVTFAGTADKYVVNSALAGGEFVIGDPGLRAAETDNDAITVGNSYTANVLLHRDCYELAIRPPASPLGGDSAEDVMIIQDPRTGIPFEISIYKGFKKAMIMVSAVWGYKAWKSDGIVNVLG
jgi:hypothetical protein